MNLSNHSKRVISIVLLCTIGLASATETQDDPHIYRVPKIIPQGPNTIFQETFDGEDWIKRWVISEKEGYEGMKLHLNQNEWDLHLADSKVIS